MNVYQIKELFYTLQGEGAQSGRPAVFCRFTGCNLWSGREEDRSKAICQFCDTDFRGTDGQNGGRYTATQLVNQLNALWPQGTTAHGYVVCTGGEPLLQLDAPLIEAMHAAGWEVAVETNGTIAAPDGIDWICVSPKAGTELVLTQGHELKLVYPQLGAEPERYQHLAFTHFYLQPMDSPQQADNTRACLHYCLANPQWRMSLQTHKILGID
jgi:7-carboxy-7-deazaguanine synthase (Cx14CxxC type)